MPTTQLALLALLIGVIIGVVATASIAFAMRARERAQQASHFGVPEGVTAVLDGMDDAAAVLAASGLIVATSPSAAPLGLFPGETLDNDDLRALVKQSRSSGSTETATTRMRRGRLSAEPRLIAARATPLSAQLGLLIVRDITEQERLDQMRQDFISNTSHELKTPVGAVSLLAEAIESAADDPEQVRVFASRLSAEAARLGRLTGRIMNLSRLQAADELTEVADLAIDEVVATSAEAQAVQAESAGVEVIRGGDRGLFVHGDAQILIEAVSNLIANAIAYSPRGSHVGVGVKAVGDVVEIAVTDQGIGIPEADQQRVFERFYRADQARSRRTGGTGLGLSIVKHAVQRHGGDVRLWSQPERGSTFTIRLPRTDPPVGDAQHPKTRKKKRSARSPKSPAIPAASVLRKEDLI